MPLDSKYKSIIEIGLLLGFAVLIAVAFSVGMTYYLGGSAHPTVAVTTGSMLPIYNGFQDDDEGFSPIHPFRGDILLVKKVPIETIEVGDVIIFNSTSSDLDEPIVHRVVAKWKNEDSGEYFFKTNGDNNEPPDGDVVLGEDVFGVVVFRVPHIGWFLLVIQTTVGRLIVLGLAILLLFIGDDSEEEEEHHDEGRENVYQDTQSQKSRIRTIGKKMISQKSYAYMVLGLGIIVLFLVTNVFYAFTITPSIGIYSITDTTRSTNLLDSSESSRLSLRRSFHLSEIQNQTTYFFPVYIEIQSGGIFNNIDRLEIRVNETKGLYRWTTVYNFIGTRVFKGAIIAIMDSGTSNVVVSVTLVSRGIFASPTQVFTFPLTLRR
ncbi:MAG: signal peptidase I [Candidatus Heimdallarchaeota archaeon]|nr:MAG: signal peptidase I [Candidatus Heimdallarchaeota archaeon]